MLTKICTKCGEEKELECFVNNKGCKDGHEGQCKACKSTYDEKYREDNFEKRAEQDIKYYEENSAKVTARMKKRYKENKEKILAINKQYREDNLEKIAATNKRYSESHSEQRAVYMKRWTKNRLKVDPAYKLLCNLRRRLGHAVKGNTKSASTMKLIGCTMEFLQAHLENQFTEGMTWDNQGEWHVDHIMPCASFDLSKEENQRECFNYKNLQPLWAEDNLKKSSKILERRINEKI